MELFLGIALSFLSFSLGSLIGTGLNFLIRLYSPKRKPTATHDSEREQILKLQEECTHKQTRQVSGLGFEYGLGVICNNCGKELKDKSRQLQEAFFQSGGGLFGHKTLGEYESACREEQELKRKWEIGSGY